MNVSIVNWVKAPGELPTAVTLDGRLVQQISSALRPSKGEMVRAEALARNLGRCFQGPATAGAGFVLSADEAAQILALPEADYSDVVRPYLIADEIAKYSRQEPQRYVIDFGQSTLEEAMAYPAALAILERRVKAQRLTNRDSFRREHWWLLGRPATALRSALAPLPRYIAGNRVGKRILFCWCEPWTAPSDAVNAFAFADDLSMGILCSGIHLEWAREQSSTLRVDIRYTPSTAFETFPWPTEEGGAVADVARRLFARRSEICMEQNIGLTKLYNQMDDGAWADLRQLHRELDEAVAAAYGWPASVAHDPDESNRRLLELNRAIAAGEVEYDPFPAPVTA